MLDGAFTLFTYEARESRLSQAFVCLCIPQWLDLFRQIMYGWQIIIFLEPSPNTQGGSFCMNFFVKGSMCDQVTGGT